MSVEIRLNNVSSLENEYLKNLQRGTWDIQIQFTQDMRNYVERMSSCFKGVYSDNIRGTSLQRTVAKEMVEPLAKKCSSEMKECKEEKNQNREINKTEEKVQKAGCNRFNLFNAEELNDKSIEEKYDNYI
jgi:hypothetical protein